MLEGRIFFYKSLQIKMCSSFFIFLLLLTTIHTQDDYDDFLETSDEYSLDNEIIKNEIKMAGLELRDDCENFANAYKSSLINNSFSEKLKVREAHAQLIKTWVTNLKEYEGQISSKLERNWTLFMKSGDVLLDDDDWKTLVSYDVGIDQYVHTETVHCHNESDNYCLFIKNGYEKLLQTSTNETVLKKAWSAWQDLLSDKKKHFTHVLNLVNKAASKNEKETAQTYWEMLVELEDGYNIANQIWDKVRPLYFKMQEYVQKQVFNFYGIDRENSQIPVYLLGSNFGNDWSYVASHILPHPQLYYQAENYIKHQQIEDIYKMAENMTKELSLGALGPTFWSNSLFNMTFCENNIVTNCVKEYSELFTCNKTSWVSYLDAFEVAADITVKKIDYVGLSQMSLRYSPIDEAVKTLASILAVKNLRYKNIWDENLFDPNVTSSKTNEMTELLLIALRVLPRLPYYLAADRWRLDLLENGFDNAEEKWWELRKTYQGVEGVTNSEADFIGDNYITFNRPYLHKFLGIVATFQILAYSEGEDRHLANILAEDENFLTMLRERSSNDWYSLLGQYYAIYDLHADSLLKYFAPLSDYLDSAPIGQIMTTQAPVSTTAQHKPNNSSHSKLKSLIEIPKKVISEKETSEVSDGPHFPPIHEHVEENLEGPNHIMDNISMYIGLLLLVAVAGIIVFVIVSKKMKKKRRNNNRRFET